MKERPAERAPRCFRRSAPELLKGGEPTVVSDIYAIGLVLFLLFTGERPFGKLLLEQARAESKKQISASHLSRASDRPHVLPARASLPPC